ncbi:hypothetical protein Plec18167_007886 [Paecilomyces lecythidis]|uniref:Mitochondrial carrier protein n=1 Tax=Paecilomyces lecythidis TaxID=3004212 RepID=A0ABR3X0N8_9EURO
MSLSSRVYNFFISADSSTSSPSHTGRRDGSAAVTAGAGRIQDGVRGDGAVRAREPQIGDEEYRSPYLHSMLAGGIGGTTGDMLMHTLDTVKTRQQGDPNFPPKYASMSSSFRTILREEGVRGLYSGVTPAFFGSFPGTLIFFGVYEFSKRHMLDAGINPSVTYLTGGFLADLAASIIYVPSEVLKTRLQLQGRYNNPYFRSGYNYRSTRDALRTIVRQEGFSALFYGYKATIFRDLPFSALQFAFYEQERKLAQDWSGTKDLNLGLEILTATTAGGMAGVITCPMDVVKTRIQTQVNTPSSGPELRPAEKAVKSDGSRHQSAHPPATKTRTQARPICTSTPSLPRPGATVLDTSSFFTGLKIIYKTEGVIGWFRGVGPRGLWTSVQSGTMLVLYQFLLKQMDSCQTADELQPL